MGLRNSLVKFEIVANWCKIIEKKLYEYSKVVLNRGIIESTRKLKKTVSGASISRVNCMIFVRIMIIVNCNSISSIVSFQKISF